MAGHGKNENVLNWGSTVKDTEWMDKQFPEGEEKRGSDATKERNRTQRSRPFRCSSLENWVAVHRGGKGNMDKGRRKYRQDSSGKGKPYGGGML